MATRSSAGRSTQAFGIRNHQVRQVNLANRSAHNMFQPRLIHMPRVRILMPSAVLMLLGYLGSWVIHRDGWNRDFTSQRSKCQVGAAQITMINECLGTASKKIVSLQSRYFFTVLDLNRLPALKCAFHSERRQASHPSSACSRCLSSGKCRSSLRAFRMNVFATVARQRMGQCLSDKTQ